MKSILLGCGAILGVVGCALADDWPMLAGRPDRNAVTNEKGLPAAFSKEDVLWAADLGDQTFSTPVISGGRVFIGTNNGKPRDPAKTGDKGVLMCFSAVDGKFLWQAVHEKLARRDDVDFGHIGICSTPCVAGDQVYYVSNRDELVCRSVEDGNVVWLLDMRKDLGALQTQAAASSPLVVGDLVFVVTGQGRDPKTHQVINPAAPSFIAVDRKTGKVIWQDGSPGDRILHAQWGSASYGVVDGMPQVAFCGGDGWLYAFEPPTGKLLWKFNLKAHERLPAGEEGSYGQPFAPPVYVGHRVLVAVGQDTDSVYDGCLRAIDARLRGDITKAGELWRVAGKEFSSSISSVAVSDGLVYAVELSGYFNCLDLETGKLVWKHDFLAQSWSIPLIADGKVYVRTGDTEIVVFRTGREKKILATNNQDNPFKLSHGSVVAANGLLYFAGQSQLYAVSARK
jgi:outer membrane protein assembly factor BamB